MWSTRRAAIELGSAAAGARQGRRRRRPRLAVAVALLGAAFAGVAPAARAQDGTFTSSDPSLNLIWESSVRTATDALAPGPLTVDARGRSCQIALPTVLVDGPVRDRCPYSIDQAVTGMTLLVSTPADAGVLGDMILWYAQHQRPDGAIPVSPAQDAELVFADSNGYWVEDLHDYVLYTGDVALARLVWPSLVRLMDTWFPAQIGPDGLLVNSLGPLDYALIPRLGKVVSYYNAVYVRALELAAQMATWLGEPGEAAAWTARIRPVAAAFPGAFWDSSAHAFVDSTVGPVVHPEDGNVFAILAGLATRSQARSALDYLSWHDAGPYGATIADNDTWDGPPWGDQASQRVYPFVSYYEVLARYAAGFDASAVELIRREWGNMARQSPTMWETVGATGTSPTGSDPSWDHGWSSGAAPALTTEVLGITPGAPGFATFVAAPHPSGLTSARGQVPTPHGVIAFSWRRTRARFTATVDSPVPGRIVFPVAGATTLDGKPLLAGAAAAGVQVGAGTHAVVVVATRAGR